MRFLTRVLILVLALAVGCSQPPPRVTLTPEQEAKIELKPVTVAELDKFVAEQKGKVVILDCWFLGCGPCVEKFPTFVKLHNDYADKGLVCASLNVYSEEWSKRNEVTTFLKERGATFPNFFFKDDEAAMSLWKDQFDANASPHYVVWDRAGKQAQLPYPQKPAAVEKRIKELLDEK